jgi:hypothetical protein
MRVEDMQEATDKEKFNATKASKDKYLAVAFLFATDRFRYRALLDDVANDVTKGSSKTTAAYKYYRGQL